MGSKREIGRDDEKSASHFLRGFFDIGKLEQKMQEIEAVEEDKAGLRERLELQKAFERQPDFIDTTAQADARSDVQVSDWLKKKLAQISADSKSTRH